MTTKAQHRQAGADDEFEQSYDWLASHVSAECAMRYREARRPALQPDNSDEADAMRFRRLVSHFAMEQGEGDTAPVVRDMRDPLALLRERVDAFLGSVVTEVTGEEPPSASPEDDAA
jgi:hypothetical protein